MCEEPDITAANPNTAAAPATNAIAPAPAPLPAMKPRATIGTPNTNILKPVDNAHLYDG